MQLQRSARAPPACTHSASAGRTRRSSAESVCSNMAVARPHVRYIAPARFVTCNPGSFALVHPLPYGSSVAVEFQRVVDEVRQALGDGVRALVLFGSRARGDAFPESDIDVAVFLNPEVAAERRLYLL